MVVKICDGTIVRLHLIAGRQMELQKDQLEGVQEGTSSLLFSQCPRFIIRWRTPPEQRFEEPFNGPIIPFGAKVAVPSIFKRKIRRGSINSAREHSQAFLLSCHLLIGCIVR